MYTAKYTNGFKRDVKAMQKRGLKMDKLKTVMQILERGEKLDKKYCNHVLKGHPYDGDYKCHVAPDWLLVYRIVDSTLIFVSTGTHSDLF